MKYLIFTLSFIGVVFFNKKSEAQQSSCQKYYDKSMHSVVYTSVDQMPEYPGGFGSFFSFFIRRVKYDDVKFEPGRNKITLVFIVDTLGNVKNGAIYKKLPKDYSKVENEFLSLLPKTLKWKPGKCSGKIVPVRLMVPFLISPQI
uniref:hypothetical protein n=1 Tax=Pedobacter schmidteae TaxID=2201271 RepID=UPI000EB3E320|nr:hypothetical protein [Pedobacter schmidteae]